MQQVGAFAGVAEAAAELHAIVGVGLVRFGGVGGVVVAQAGRRVELEHPHAAEPGAEGHPHVAVVIGFHARVDGVDAGVGLRGVTGDVGILAKHLRHVGLLHVHAFEAGIDHRANVRPIAFDVVGGEQHDHRTVVRAVDRHVHAPLAHGLVPDHVRCPHVAFDVRIGGLLRPAVPNVFEDLLVVGAQIVGEGAPVDQIVAFEPSAMRAENIVFSVGFDDGGIMRFAALDAGGAGFGFRRCGRLLRRIAGASGERSDQHGCGDDACRDLLCCCTEFHFSPSLRMTLICTTM